MGSLSPNAKQQFFTNAGLPASGCKLYTYTTGSSSTPLATYTDKAATAANTNPIILDARGEAIMYLLPKSYRYVLTDSVGSPIWTRDDVSGPSDAVDLATPSATGGSALVGFLQGGIGASPRTAQDKMRENVSVKDFGAKGDGVTDDTAAVLAAMTYLQGAGTNRGGVLIFPSGVYIIKQAMNFVASGGVHNIIVRGNGRQCTVLDFSQAPANTNGITFAVGSQFGIEDLTVTGCPGTGNGIFVGLGNVVGSNNFCAQFHLRNVRAQLCGGDGIHFTNAFMGTVQDCWATLNTARGFRLDGFHTSMHFSRSWGSQNTGANWSINGLVYSTFVSCGADLSATAWGWQISNCRGVSFLDCGAESNSRDGFFLTSSNASTTGLPASSQDIHGVVFQGCYALNNSTAGAGLYATFIAAVTGDSRNIDFSVIGGSATPATVTDVAFVLNGASGTVLHTYELTYYDGFTAPDVVAGSVSRINKAISGFRSIAVLGSAQSLTSGATTTVTWSSTLSANDLGATVVSSGIVIPKGVNKIRVSACLDFAANVTGVRQLIVQKNGANLAGIPTVAYAAASAGDTIANAVSAPISVAAGDSITVQAFQNSGGALNINASLLTWFCVEAVN